MDGCDYYSRQGFDPAFWGPGAWTLLHVAAANYPCQPTQRDKLRFARLVQALAESLPCMSCRAHFAELLRGPLALSPEVLGNRFTAFEWTVRVHNAVNARLGKQVFDDADAWFRMYSAFRAS